MKKLQKLAIVFTAFVFSFFSCAQITDPVNVNTNETTKFGSKQITITVASSEDIVKFETNSNARTILPDALVSGNLDYYMWDDKDTSSTPEKVTFTAKEGSNTEGTVSKALEAKEYTLILAAVPSGYTNATITKDIILQAALLTASATIDFRYTDKVHFYLTPNKTTGVEGNIDLTLKGIGDWVQSDISTVTASMYKKDGSLVDKKEDLKDSFFTTGSNYKLLDSIPAGIYIFEIEFKTNNDKTYKWNDDLIILPNQITTKTVDIPNIIGKKPDKPANFIAGYTIPENNTDEYYTVTLNWDDEANNEFYYDLEVIELSAIPTDDTTWSDETWTTLAATSTTKLYSGVEDTNRKLFADSADCLVYNSGNLYRNSESVTMKLILGSLYFARIRAANVAGESAWVYLDLNNNPAATGNFTSKVMNLFKVSYDLRDGIIDPADTELTNYYNAGTEVPIIKPKTSADGTETITVTLGEKYWQKWTNAKGDNFTEDTYSGFKNLELFANYDTNMDVTIVNPQDYELMNTITVKAGTTPIDPTDSTYTYNINDGDLTISYAINATTPAYDKFEFIITSPINDYFKLKAEGTKASDNASATFDANKFSTGTYIFTIAAYIDGKKYTTWSVLNVIEQ